MGMVTAFKLPAELRRTLSRERKRGEVSLFSLSHVREAMFPAGKMS